MALKIRLSRGGTTHNPHYAVVVIESAKKRDGQAIEKVGHYHPTMPKTNNERVSIDLERYQYWIQHGAKPTKVIERLVGNLSS